MSIINSLENVFSICDKLDVKGIGVKQGRTRELLKLDLLKFTFYINSGCYNAEERKFVKENLGFTLTTNDMYTLRKEVNQNDLEVPNSVKYMLLSDMKKTLEEVPNKYKTIIKIYEIFGENFIACNKVPKTNQEELRKYTEFMTKLKNFSKDFDMNSLSSGGNIKKVENDDSKSLDELLAELNSLTGLESVKNDVNELINLIKIQKIRKENGLKTTDISKHMVFSGAPGTGKTTVARILSRIYKQMGVCSKGHLVEVDRSGLVVGYIGQTATKTTEVINASLGGILFIDEAYALTVGKGDGDFGQEAVDTLLKAMEDHRDDLIVIVAGYTNLMEQFISSNPGLKSRFNKFIKFESFTKDQLIEIIKKQAEDKDYFIEEDAYEYIKKYIDESQKEDGESFANARSMRNILEKAITNQATRIVNVPEKTKDILCLLTKQDFEKG